MECLLCSADGKRTFQWKECRLWYWIPGNTWLYKYSQCFVFRFPGIGIIATMTCDRVDISWIFYPFLITALVIKTATVFQSPVFQLKQELLSFSWKFQWVWVEQHNKGLNIVCCEKALVLWISWNGDGYWQVVGQGTAVLLTGDISDNGSCFSPVLYLLEAINSATLFKSLAASSFWVSKQAAGRQPGAWGETNSGHRCFILYLYIPD